MFEPGSVVEAGARPPEDLWEPPAETDAGWAELPEVLPAWLLDTVGAAGFWPDTDCRCSADRVAARPDPAGAVVAVGWSIPG